MSDGVYPRVNRVEVIDRTGRAFTRMYDGRGAYLQLQDDGRTLKVFVTEPGWQKP